MVAKSIDIAVAFITAAGLDSLLYLLQKTASRGQVRILAGLYQGFTDSKALRMLLREQHDSKGSFKVHIVPECSGLLCHQPVSQGCETGLVRCGIVLCTIVMESYFGTLVPLFLCGRVAYLLLHHDTIGQSLPGGMAPAR